jgi:hypothetical protein
MFLNWDFPSGIKCDDETSVFVVFWEVAVSRPVLGPTQPPIQWTPGIRFQSKNSLNYGAIAFKHTPFSGIHKECQVWCFNELSRMEAKKVLFFLYIVDQ